MLNLQLIMGKQGHVYVDIYMYIYIYIIQKNAIPILNVRNVLRLLPRLFL